MKTSFIHTLAAAVVIGFSTASAIEKNGVSVEVRKTTLERNDQRNRGYLSDRIDRTQGVKVIIKNTSIKPQPEGEVVWTTLRLPYSSNYIEGKTGTETLKSLRPGETVEMIIGQTQITGYSGYVDNAYKDKMEHRVVVKHNDVEIVRLDSTSNFDSMARKAEISKSRKKNTEDESDTDSKSSRKKNQDEEMEAPKKTTTTPFTPAKPVAPATPPAPLTLPPAAPAKPMPDAPPPPPLNLDGPAAPAAPATPATPATGSKPTSGQPNSSFFGIPATGGEKK